MPKRIAKRATRKLTHAEEQRLDRALETVDDEVAELLPAARKRRAASAALRDTQPPRNRGEYEFDVQ